METNIKKRILKTLEDCLLINRAFMEESDIKDLEEQIEAVKGSIAVETSKQNNMSGNIRLRLKKLGNIFGCWR